MPQSARRQVLIALLATVAVLATLALVLWRTLPPVIALPSEDQHAGAPPYRPMEDLPTVLPSAAAAGISFAIIREPANEQMHAPGDYEHELLLWEEWLTSMGAAAVDAPAADVLVLPSAECLGVDSRRLIAEHLTGGGGIITAGTLGAFDGMCLATGDTILTALLGGGDVIAPYGRTMEESFNAILPGGTVLGAGIPPGPRIGMTPANQIAFRGPDRELYYSGYDRRPRAFREVPYYDGGAVRSTVGDGRVAAFGFLLQTLADDWSRRIVQLVLANAMRWAAGQPVYQLGAWPHGYRAAAVMAQDVEADYHNARNVVRAHEDQEILGTAFIVGRLAEADPSTTAHVLRYREIATHTYSHLPLDTMSYAAQARELDLSKRVTEQIAHQPVRGLRPPEERFNMETLKIWAELGGTYVFGASNMRLAAPEIVPVLPDSMVLLSRVTPDDFEILSRSGMRDLTEISHNLVADIEHVISVGGLYMFSYHSHMFAQKPLVSLLQGLREHVAAQPQLWNATGAEVASWWRGRSYIELEDTAEGVRVLNTGPSPFTRGSLIIDRADGSRVRVELPPIQPGEALTVSAAGSVS